MMLNLVLPHGINGGGRVFGRGASAGGAHGDFVQRGLCVGLSSLSR